MVKTSGFDVIFGIAMLCLSPGWERDQFWYTWRRVGRQLRCSVTILRHVYDRIPDVCKLPFPDISPPKAFGCEKCFLWKWACFRSKFLHNLKDFSSPNAKIPSA